MVHMTVSILILMAGAITGLFIVGIYTFSIWHASKTIFAGSDAPISMSQALLSSLHITGQLLFGVIAVIVLSVLMTEGIINSEAGLPIFSAMVAYLLGKGYKDISFLPKSKSSDDSIV